MYFYISVLTVDPCELIWSNTPDEFGNKQIMNI